MDDAARAAVQAERPDGPTIAAWTGFLGPAVAALGLLGASYFGAFLACQFGRRAVLHGALAAAACALLASALAWRLARRASPPPTESRRLLVVLGGWSLLLFLLVAVAIEIPRLYLWPCAQY
jgi:hypothetical protein